MQHTSLRLNYLGWKVVGVTKAAHKVEMCGHVELERPPPDPRSLALYFSLSSLSCAPSLSLSLPLSFSLASSLSFSLSLSLSLSLYLSHSLSFSSLGAPLRPMGSGLPRTSPPPPLRSFQVVRSLPPPPPPLCVPHWTPPRPCSLQTLPTLTHHR